MSQSSTHDIDQMIGHALRSMRLRRSYTQAELAAALGVTRPTVTHYEAGTRSLNAAQLVQAARVLDCTLEELVPGMPRHAAPIHGVEPTGPIAQVVRILHARPDLLSNVLDLLETMLQLSAADAVTEQPVLTG